MFLHISFCLQLEYLTTLRQCKFCHLPSFFLLNYRRESISDHLTIIAYAKKIIIHFQQFLYLQAVEKNSSLCYHVSYKFSRSLYYSMSKNDKSKCCRFYICTAFETESILWANLSKKSHSSGMV